MLPGEQDVDDFLDSVSEVSRLISGLKAGTISADYVDSKILKDAAASSKGRAHGQPQETAAAQPALDALEEAARQAELQKKLEEVKASRQRKLKAQQLYEQYAQEQQQQYQQLYATDYTKWDLWCPSDDEDELFNSCTPNTPQFRALDKDITDRHTRMIEQRQIAERQRQQGNAAFKAGQFSEALRCYQQGLESQRHNMALHANAAAAALKLKCYVQALEHCDKVLHLAEVLYNKPRHELCVKALQRRAAAYQGLEQHSKAVADLEAAAVMLPDDSDIAQQLQAAKALSAEHKIAKSLRHLVAGPTDGSQQQQPGNNSSSSSCSGSLDLASLQQIEHLTTGLNAAAAESTAGPSIAASCSQLRGLIVQEPRHSTYFRECSGLRALAKLVPKLKGHAALAAAMQLLATACENSTTLQHLCSQHAPLLAAALDCIPACAEPATGCACDELTAAAAAAAADLAHTASTVPTTRQAVCQQLLLQPATLPTQQRWQPAQENPPCASSRMEQLWMFACSTQQPEADGAPSRTLVQATAAALLSNCLLAPAVRDAAAAMLLHRPAAVRDWAKLLQAGSSNGSSSAAAALREKLYSLISNASSHAVMRTQLAEHQPLVEQLIAAALGNQQAAGAAPGGSCVAAAMGCLCNLSLEACVQQQLAVRETVTLLLHLTCGAASNGSMAASCKPGAARGAGLGTQLPSRKGGQQQQQQQQQAPAVGDAEAMIRSQQQQRASVLLSRVAKCAAGLQQLQVQGALGQLLQALGCQVQEQQQARDERGTAAWVEAVVRTIALLTAAPGTCASCGFAQASAAIDACLQLLRGSSGAALKGNAALCLGHFAGERQWHQLLQAADAVEVLVKVAYEGKGDASSKNAAIALAKMAKSEQMMERLREMHGLEIIYQIVKP